MTAINSIIHPEYVFIGMDSLAAFPETKEPYKFVTKIFPLIHLNMVICGTGIYQFICDWYFKFNCIVTEKEISGVDKMAPCMLQSLWEKYKFGPNENSVSTIFHFGYDAKEKYFRAFKYRSENNFASEEYECKNNVVTIIKPETDYEIEIASLRIEDIPNIFKEILIKQRSDDMKLPQCNRFGIGGDLQIACLTPSWISLQSLKIEY